MRIEGLARPASQGGTKAYRSGRPTEQTRWQQTCKDAKGGGEKPTSFGLMVIWYLPDGGKKWGDEVTAGKEFQPAWLRGKGSGGDLGHPSLGPRANPGRELGGGPSRLRRGKRKWPMSSERRGAHLTNTQLDY